MRLIVGITGHARAGKDSIGLWAEKRGAMRASFAGPIKQAICVMFGLTNEAFENATLKETKLDGIGKSPRELAQLLGTEFGRDIVGPDCWVKSLEMRLASVDRIMPEGAPVFITDVRFDNEADWIRKQNGLILHVRRNGADGKVGVAGHASEAGVGFRFGDILIDNNESIEALHLKLEHIFPRSPGFGIGDTAIFGNTGVTQNAPAVTA